MLSNHTYHCPVCGEDMTRELLLFLAHTKEHIYEILKKEHPEWRTAEDSEEPYEKYFQAQFTRRL